MQSLRAGRVDLPESPTHGSDAHETGDTRTGFESGERDFVNCDGRQSDQRHEQRAIMEEGHTEQRQSEQDEI